MNNTPHFLAKTGIASMLLLCLLIMSSTGALAGSQLEDQETSVHLNHAPYGTAQLGWNSATQQLTVTVKLTGLQAGSSHPAHIHSGTSCASNGGIVYTLNNVVADQSGNATTTTVIKNVRSGIPQTGWYINIHNGPTLETPDQALAITCGTITNPQQAQAVTTTLGTTPDANQNAMGDATLMLQNGTLAVKVTISNLVPGSSHAAHIHTGRCAQQVPGTVVYPLETLVANASGVATSETSIPNVQEIPATTWYINLHFGTDLSTQTGYDPIACGDIK